MKFACKSSLGLFFALYPLQSLLNVDAASIRASHGTKEGIAQKRNDTPNSTTVHKRFHDHAQHPSHSHDKTPQNHRARLHQSLSRALDIEDVLPEPFGKSEGNSHLKMGMRGSIGFDSDGKPLVYINVDPRIGLVDIDVVSSTIFSFRNPVQSEDQNKRFGNLGYNESTCLTLSHHELWALSLEECLQDLTQSSTAQRTQVFQIDEKDWVRPVFWRTSKTVEPLQVDDSQADDVHSLIPGGDNNEALADEVMKIEDASLDALVPSTNTSDPPQNSSATSLSLSSSPIPTMVTFQDETPPQANTSWSSQLSLEETLSRRYHSSRSIPSSSMGEFVLVPGVDFWYIYQWKFWRSD